MTLPNLMIIGAQKCGTTWLHHALDKSEHFWGSQKKELNFWNRPHRDLGAYARHFEGAPPSARFLYESTPHYFRLPRPHSDTAAEIRMGLGDIPLILLLRDPVERYLSAYTHHIMQGRFAVVEEITDLRDDYGLFSLGCYFPILQHFQTHFSKIHIALYDHIAADPMEVITDLFAAFDLPVDIEPADLDFRVNDKHLKRRRLAAEGLVFPKGLPVLSASLRQELRERYRDSVRGLREEVGLDVGHWLAA